MTSPLTAKYGRGFGISTLKDIRQFFLTYPHFQISHAVRGQLEETLCPNLGWIHYRALMRVQQREGRQFYEIETEKNHWSGRELERQGPAHRHRLITESEEREKLHIKGSL